MSPQAVISRIAVIFAGLALAVGMSLVPTTVHAAGFLIVTTSSDSGSCPNGAGQPGYTLRCAITQANSDGSGDTIIFRAAGCCDIKLASALPTVTASSTTIDGYELSTMGAAPNTNALFAGDNAVIKVTVDGSGTPIGTDGIVLTGSNDTVRGLNIVNFAPDASENGGYGVVLLAPIFGGGPVTGQTVEGNFIGVSTNGTTAEPNSAGVGVAGGSHNAIVGGTTAAQENVISGNSTLGVELILSTATTVEGNLIGTSAAGSAAVPNGLGVEMAGGVSGVVIGTPSAGNVISGNTGWGIENIPISGGTTGGLGGTIEGNGVGVNAAGTGQLGNGAGGVLINPGQSFQIGGTAAGSGNVISGNGVAAGSVAPGVELSGNTTTNNTVEGNFIGLTAGGSSMPNAGDGVLVESGASFDAVGQPGSAAAGNTIANNGGYGVDLGNAANDSVHVSINLNSMYGNALGGINLSGQLPLFCTSGAAYVANTTPNDLLPCPLILAATPTRIAGEACTGCTVEIYLTPGAGDDEGKTLLGTLTAGTCASPPCTNFTAWSFPAASYSQALAVGEHITATSTVSIPGYPTETSSFSRNVPVGTVLTVNTTADAPSPCSSANYSLRCAITQANADGKGDEIDFNIPSAQCGPICKLQLGSELPAVQSSSTYIDGYSQAGATPNSNSLAAGDNATINVQLNGTGLPAGTNNGLKFINQYVSVEGLAITNFSGDGVLIGTHNFSTFDIVAGDLIGAQPDAAAAGPNGTGVDIESGGAFATIGGRAIVDPNVISGNASYGVESSGVGGNTLREDLIGVTGSDNGQLPNGYDGVLLFGTTADTVGGLRSGEGNVISGNFNDGVEGLDTKLTTVMGNEIGVDGASDANVAVGNGFAGVFLYLGADNLVGDLPFGVGGNIIAGNAADGVDVLAETGDLVGGNVIGYVQPNGGSGVMTGNSSFITGEFGNHTFGPGMSRRAVRRMDQIGPVVGGETPQYDGVATNLIAGNGQNGVLVGQSPKDADVHTLITTNSMSSDGGGNGIEFFGSNGFCFGYNPGPSDGLFCPVISNANTSTVSGTACNNCIVEVFQATNAKATQGYGEGESYLGTATADSSGNWSLGISKAQLPAGDYVTATATNYVLNSYQQVGSYQFETSMFSQNVQITQPGSAKHGVIHTLGVRHPAKHSGVNWKWLKRHYFSRVPSKLLHYHVRYRPR